MCHRISGTAHPALYARLPDRHVSFRRPRFRRLETSDALVFDIAGDTVLFSDAAWETVCRQIRSVSGSCIPFLSPARRACGSYACSEKKTCNFNWTGHRSAVRLRRGSRREIGAFCCRCCRILCEPHPHFQKESMACDFHQLQCSEPCSVIGSF